MDKKLIYRIVGAVASALIIVSVFVPFVNVFGYTSNLWKIYKLAESLYLPIMIIIFGVIGVVFFSLNIKTEFAYMSTGAISFFVIMETLSAINRNEFGSLSIGYYCLVIGAIVTGVMAFLLGLKPKNIVAQAATDPAASDNILNKIDQLYDTPVQPIEPIQQVNNVELAQPLEASVQPIQPIPEVQPLQEMSAPIAPVNPMQEFSAPVAPVNPVQEFSAPTTPVNPMQEMSAPVAPVNPVQEFSAPAAPVNPVQEFSAPAAPVNPVQEFSAPAAPVNPVQEFSAPTAPVNPVQEFSAPAPNFGTPLQEVQPLEAPTQNTNESQVGMDIFRQ